MIPPHESLILNVDDYAPGRYARTRLLKQGGFAVIEAGSGAEALRLVEEEKPALILLDVNLPDMNGFDLCKQMRRNPRLAGTTILHISASSILTQHQVSGLESGADGYMVEPVEPAVLLATVNAFLRARRAEEAMRRSSEELRWFAYRVGHDMGEPLRTITAYAQLLKIRLEGHQNPETLKLLDFIAEGAYKIRSFMDGLLEYSQVAAGGSEIKKVDCEAILEQVLENLNSAIRDSAAKITHGALPEVTANEQMECVFQNLISNAIKYARPGVPPEIHISAARQPKEWVFAVKDNGSGIARESQDRVFEIFHRLHGPSIHGNGIGLALVRRIMESFGGSIQVESEVNKGTTFFLTLPA